MKQKIKIISSDQIGYLEDKVNEFLLAVNVIDLSFSVSRIDNRKYDQKFEFDEMYYCLIRYEI